MKIALAASLGICVVGSAAQATKLSAPPLPRERQAKDFESGQTSIVQTSRFQRRPDYREVEAQKKKEEEEAAKRAEEAKLRAAEDARRAQSEQIENVKKRQQVAAEANNRAVTLGKQGNWSEAIAQHEEAVKLDPGNKQFRINLSAARTAFGQARLQAGDIVSAQALFRKALAAAPDNGLAGRLLAECMQKSGRNPANADVRLAIGDQLAAIGDFESASVEYQAAMQLEGSARCYVKMGDMALRFGQVTTATNWYRQAIVKDPDHGSAHRQLGLLALAQKDFTGAAASLRKAVICDPKDVAAGQALVDIWRRQVAANPLLADNHLGLAGALQLTGDFASAEGEYRKLETLDPKHPALEPGRQSLARAIQHAKADKHRLAAETLFNQGLRREALAEISQAVMMEPRNAKYQFLLGECLEANGDYQGAHRAYLTCVLIDPENNKEAAARMKEMQGGIKRSGIASRDFAQMPAPPANQVANQFAAPPTQPLAQRQDMPAVQGFPGKDMFEAAPGAAQAAPAAAAASGRHDQPAIGQSLPSADARQQAAQMQARQQQLAQQQAAQARQQMAQQQAQQQAAQQQAAQQQAAQQQAAQQQAARQKAAQQQRAAAPAEDPAVTAALARTAELEADRDHQGAVAILKQVLTTNLQNAEVHHRLAVNLLAMGQITEAISEFRIASALSPGKRAYADDLARAMVIHKRSLMSDAGNSNNGVTDTPEGGAQ